MATASEAAPSRLCAAAGASIPSILGSPGPIAWNAWNSGRVAAAKLAAPRTPQWNAYQAAHRMSSTLSGPELDKEVEHIQDLFVTARDEIEYAKEEADTVYFNESVAEARAAVEACLSAWSGLLARLGEAERGKLQRAMGLKMEQLKAELDQVSNTHLEE